MCYCRRCRERRRARANIKDHEQTVKVEFARDAARASSGIAKSGRVRSAALTATKLIDTLQGPPTPASGFSLAATDSGWSRAFRFLERELEPISEHRGSRTAISGFRTGCASRVRVRVRGRNPVKVAFIFRRLGTTYFQLSVRPKVFSAESILTAEDKTFKPNIIECFFIHMKEVRKFGKITRRSTTKIELAGCELHASRWSKVWSKWSRLV